MFELGPGPICWLYMSEIMNEKGVAVGTFINWSFTFLTGLITPILFNYLGQKTFLIFSLVVSSMPVTLVPPIKRKYSTISIYH